MTVTDMNAYRGGRRRIGSILVTVGLVMAGCASSGDVEQVRQERAQAKAKMSTELQQERTLAQSMEKESEARKAEADKLAKALGGGAAGAGGAAARPRMGASLSAMSLTAALQNNNCLDQIAAQGKNPSVPQALFIGGTLPTKGGNSACTSVTVSATDATAFTAATPLIPVVVGSGGTLTLVDPGAGSQMSLYASSFLIQNAGTMQAGTVASPIGGRITIVMAGNSSAALAPQASGSASIVATSNNTPNSRDITVMDGGMLALYGGKGLSATPDGTHNKPVRGGDFINTLYGTKSWTYLAAPAGPAKYNDAENVSAPVPATNPSTTLTLATTVDWQQNDWISVATTSFSSHQTEIVQICGISSVANPDPQTSTLGLPANVSQITLCQNLKHYHYGGLTPTPGFFPAGTKQVVAKGGNAIDVSRQAKSFYDDHTRNYGIDERAEVALLSRNIKLTSVAGQSSDANNYIGGHLVAMASGTTSPTLTLVGVEIEKFGQGLTGRYPVHLHKLPSGNNVLIQDVSVHHSYNKCYVVHATANANFYNNVCVRTVGQGMYLEDNNNITGNQFMRNHIAGTMAANTTYSYPRANGSTYWDGDNLQGSQASATWYTASGVPDTSVSGANTGVGPDQNFPGGFWITNLGNTFVNNSVAGCQAQGRGYWLLTQQNPTTKVNQNHAYPEFSGNRTHGCYNGIDANADTVTADNPVPFLPSVTSNPITKVTIPSVTVTSSTAFPGGASTVAINGVPGMNGTWPVTNIQNTSPPYSFGVKNAIPTGTYTSGGTWQIPPMPILTASKASGQDVVVAVPGGIPDPTVGAQVTITGTNTAADNTWTVGSVTPPPTQGAQSSFTLKNSSTVSGAGFPATSGQWQLQSYPITGITLPPIVIATSSTPPPTGTPVTISGTGTTADNSWTVTTPAVGYGSGTFSLNGSAGGSGTYGGTGGTWQVARQAPVLLLNDNTVTRSRQRGLWIRTIFTTLHNNRFATNPYGFSLLGGGGPEGNPPGYWGLAHENVIAGMTRNNVERYPAGCHFLITNVQSTSGPPNYTPNAPNGSGQYFTVITTPKSPSTGTQVLISNVQGSIAGSANGTWTITQINATQFALSPPFNQGTYTAGSGVWQIANSPATWETECTDVALYGNNWGNFPNPKPGSSMNIQGYSYYDGPARIEHNRFVNFRFDPTGIHPNDPAARLLTQTDIQYIARFNTLGQLHGTPTPNLYSGYAGDPATGWIQSNAQTVPPTQYIRDSIWDNVDFKHQVYTEAVNLGAFNDGDKTTVILDKDGQLSGVRVVDGSGASHHDVVPVSLNSVDYYATDYTVDEPHSRGPNDFRATSLMSPHKYATLNIESVDDPAGASLPPPSPPNTPTYFHAVVQRDMPAYGDTVYPSLFLNGRGQNPIYEPFVMDRMGYTVYGVQGTENYPTNQSPLGFKNRLLFSYTDPGVKKAGEFFVNRIAVYQPVTTPANIKVYRIRRQWGQAYDNPNVWPPNYNPPVPSPSCDHPFFAMNQTSTQETGWTDCQNRANNVPPYTGGMTLPAVQGATAAEQWTNFEQPYKTLMAKPNPTSTDIANFIAAQSFYYDTTNNMLYFYMIEDQPVMRQYSPFGTCDAANYKTGANYLAQIQQIKSFSDPHSVQRALDVSCLVAAGVPQPIDLFPCSENGCAAYLVDLSTASVTVPTALPPSTPTHPITRTAYSTWNRYHFVYDTPTQQPNGLPVVANPAIGNTTPPTDGAALIGLMTPTDGTAPPAGDQVTYTFQTQTTNVPSSITPPAQVQVTENFRYHCVTTPPWAPVNARGAYPPTGGFTYPLAPTVCTNP